MVGSKCVITALCLSLSLNGFVGFNLVSNTVLANQRDSDRARLIANADFSAGSNRTARLLGNASDLIAQGELIEAPAKASAYVSIKGVGHLFLAGGTKVKLISLLEESDSRQQTFLAASVIDGDVIIKLHPQAGALVQAGESTMVSARGASFHAGVHNGTGVFDASERVAMRLNNWAIRMPSLAPELGNWTINVPDDVAAAPRTVSTVSEEKKIDRLRGELKPLRLDYKASARPIGRVESLGAMVINTRLNRNYELLWGDELIQSPEGMNAIATLETIGQVTLTGGSRARLTATKARGEKNRPVLTASLLNGTAIFRLETEASAYVQAAGAKYVAARGSRFRVMIIEGRALIDNAGGVVGEIGDWRLSAASVLPDIIPQVGQQAVPRRYLVRPVGLNSNLVVKARATRQIQVRVTDENDQPVTGVPVIFSLGSSGASSLGLLGTGSAVATSAKVFTNAQGIASVNFTAGTEATSGSISATVEGTNATWVGQISLLKVVPGFWTPANAIPVVATAAAAITVGAVSAATNDDSRPVRATGPTIIKP